MGVYRDGVYYGVQTGLTFQMFDLERTEVLRGPQGTLYGKNTTGGTVNLHSRLPGDEFGGYFKASYGNYKSFNFEGAVDIPINEKAAARVAFARRKTDGWIDNHFPGGIDDLMSTDHWAFRTILSWEPTEDLSLLLNAHGGRLQSDWTYIGRGLMDPDDVHPESFNFIDPATGDFRPGVRLTVRRTLSEQRVDEVGTRAVGIFAAMWEAVRRACTMSTTIRLRSKRSIYGAPR